MRQVLAILLLLVVGPWADGSAAAAERKLALVIGNNAYPNLARIGSYSRRATMPLQ